MEERGLNSARGRVLFFFDGRKFEDSKSITFFCREKSNKKALGCVSPYASFSAGTQGISAGTSKVTIIVMV
jgi:hypothetical protein